VTHPHEQEAASWVATKIKRLRNLSYDDLLALEGQREHRPMETKLESVGHGVRLGSAYVKGCTETEC
jgi:hypothetical protein